MHDARPYLQRFLADERTEIGGCLRCHGARVWQGPLRMAFQPIVDVARHEVFADEALVRGPEGEPTGDVLATVTEDQLVEMTEAEKIRDPQHALSIVRDDQRRGFLIASDDFGAGYSGLNLLAEFQPQLVKLDMALVRDIDRHRARQAIVGGVMGACATLGVGVIAEGVETQAEYDQLRAMGVTLFQGYFVARPALEALPEPDWSALA